MNYNQLRDDSNYHKVSINGKTEYFDDYTDAIAFIRENGLPHTFHSVWTDCMGYMQETVHTF